MATLNLYEIIDGKLEEEGVNMNDTEKQLDKVSNLTGIVKNRPWQQEMTTVTVSPVSLLDPGVHPGP